MFVNVVLGGQSFQLPNTPADKERRKAFFAALTTKPAYADWRPGAPIPEDLDAGLLLKPEEYQLLDSLQITGGKRLIELSNELPRFFESLPVCAGDTSMMLKRECDIAYYVLWSVLYKMQLQNQDARTENAKKHAMGLTKMAAHEDILAGLDGIHKDPPEGFDAVAILRLFTRPAHPALQRLPGNLTEADVRKMFTLRGVPPP